MVLTAYTHSPRCTGLFSHRRFANRSWQNLIPASGDQDHTILPSAPNAARLATPARPSHPVPTSVAIGQTPLSGRIRMRGDKHIFRKNGRGILGPKAESSNHHDSACEIGFLVQRSPREPTRPRAAQPDDKLRDTQEFPGGPDVASAFALRASADKSLIRDLHLV
jgi:hypothetical protein